MNTTLRTGALALALIAGTALVAAPAMAGHDHWKKKSWNHHGYKYGKKHYSYGHKHYGYRNYGWNRGYGYRSYGWRPYGYGYGYGRPAYGWPYYYGGSGFSIIIR